MITAKMATYPARERQLPIALNSILHQVDRLDVYCNAYDRIPSCLENPKIKVLTGEDIGDTGKVVNMPREGYVFLVDDDIVYPQYYVHTMVENLKKLNNSSIIGLHAAILNFPVKNYFRDREVIHFRGLTPSPRRVHVLGTGVMAFHTDYFWMDETGIEHHNMLDINLAIRAQKEQKRMIAVRKKANWMKSIPTSESLWDARGNGAIQTKLINSIDSWKLY